MSKLPEHYTKFLAEHPQVGQAYRALGEAVASEGPLDAKTCELVKIGISLGAQMEGALRSHVRKALQAGATRQEIEHAILQGTTTVGFPAMMAGLKWAMDVFENSK